MVDKIDHYSLTNPATIYDEEAMTALELAGRTAGKVNECVDEVNKIPDTVAKDVDKHIKNGEFDRQISKHLNNLDERVDNLLGSVTEGSTTMDAEVIDGRVDHDGITHANLGKAIREQGKRACFAMCFVNQTPVVTFTTTSVRLQIPGNTEIYFAGKSYRVSGIDVSLTHPGLSLFWVCYNHEIGVIDLVPFAQTLPSGYVIIGHIYQGYVKMNGDIIHNRRNDTDSDHPFYALCYCESPVYSSTLENGDTLLKTSDAIYLFYGRRYVASIGNLSITVPTSGDGNLFGLYVDLNTNTFRSVAMKTNDPMNGYVNIGYYHRYNGVMMNDVDAHRFTPQTLCAVILGDAYSRHYVDFDSSNKTVTFPNDTLIMFNGGAGTPEYYISIKTTESVSYADIESSAIKIIYDRRSRELSAIKYNTPIDPLNQYVLCTFRDNGSVSITCPYRWDGKPFNIDLPASSGESENTMVKSINHRGYNTEAPENTLSAFKLSADRGFKYVEADVRFTSDNVPVILHDATVDRTSNGTGNINALTFAEARALDFGSWYGSRFAGEKIPSLEEFLSLCKSKGILPYIEIKDEDITVQRATIFVNYIKRFSMIDSVTIISPSIKTLATIRSIVPDIRCGWVLESVETYLINELNTTIENPDVNFFLDVHYTTISDSSILMCVENNTPLEVWTVNDKANLSNLNPYISGVTSDILHAGKELNENPFKGVIVPVITAEVFNVDYDTFAFEYGMTWAEWVESSYNIDNYYTDGSYIRRADSSQVIKSFEPFVPVTPDEKIEQGRNYMTY